MKTSNRKLRTLNQMLRINSNKVEDFGEIDARR